MAVSYSPSIVRNSLILYLDPAKTASAEGAAFTAYAVDPAAADPLVKALHELITHVSKQDARIAHLCQTIESMGSKVEGQAATLDAQRLNKLVDE